jgi:glycosyltransferase involved in cell wall biosynthesis
MNPLPTITALIPTKNVAHLIQPVLESVSWADEILVVDSYSTDQTLAICESYGARIIQHEYINSAKQKNWALQHSQSEWIFQIDTDEVLEAGFYEEMVRNLSDVSPNVQAFRIPRKNHILGQWIRHCGIYPDYQKRLFRRDAGRWIEREVHAHVQVPGDVGTFSHHILHHGMPNLSKQIKNLDRYTRYEADELRNTGARFRLVRLLFHPWGVFFKRYLLHSGFRDGMRGFVYCVYLAMYDFLSYAKLWEIETLNLPHSPRS